MSSVEAIVQDPSRIREIERQNALNIPSQEESARVQDLVHGQTFTGKVVAMDGNTAKIDVNGTSISASLDGNIDLKEGQMVTFTLRNQSNNSITVSPMFTNLNQQNVAQKALMAASLPVNSSNMGVAGSMLEAGLSVDRDSITDVIRAHNNYPSEDIGKLAEMEKYGLEINDNNLEKFSAFKNYKEQVTEGIRNIIDSVPDTVNSLMKSGNETQAYELLGRAIKTFTAGTDTQGSSNFTVNPNQANAETLSVGAPPKIMASKDVQGMGEAGESLIREKQVISEDRIVLREEALNPEMDKLIEDAGTKEVIRREDFEVTVRVPGQESQKINIEINTKVADAWQSLPNTDKSAMVDVLKQTGLGEEEAKYLLSDKADQNDFLNSVSDLIVKGNLTDSLKELVQSEDFGNILRNQMQAQWLLAPIDVEKKENVEQLYDRLNQKTKDLTEAISGMPIPEGKLQSSLDDMKQNLDFMEQMNQMAQYVQLPLKMNGSEATGDLYIYTDKRKLSRKEGNVSALLHLDMKNLGPMDVYASITPGNNVFTKFYLQDDAMIDFINDNIHILNQRLSQRGYTMKSELTTKDNLPDGRADESDIMAMKKKIESDPNNKLTAKYGFDCFA